ncbi:hypothetical protein AO053_04935 [Haemophilus influenzae biotype aegyptius]|uniref:hypothetical protein n=1 Tax=Haemophilus influenzae TaxID=727 RepID=UPI0001F3716B|nr:hypothetical protein [Haemophilus influenzae]QEQ61206.1 hypothetical protein F1539_01670 [Haemophilus influenzae biotype aegyptius]QEQ63300.1 hypothetical protein F1538_03265 [Haemophilus influenzae biotype aegyptius]QEQ64766.1 hypothetical protein F1537_01045 [Haemophilus influenzae biotype aegyptius]TMQ38644.1 hypothetical protein AO053_04935 [Haemophilus influenzae biotype aegyptius]TMQ39840.1 hypothetical protein AO052_03515 [Haemophilus influenzae biotype aegyptius]
MKHSKTPLRQEKQSFTHFMKGSEKWLTRISYFLAALVISLIVGGISLDADANPTDWHDNELSLQIQQEAREKAKAQWREENGIYQANLTPQVNADIYRYVEQKQAEINRTLGEKQ